MRTTAVQQSPNKEISSIRHDVREICKSPKFQTGIMSHKYPAIYKKQNIMHKLQKYCDKYRKPNSNIIHNISTPPKGKQTQIAYYRSPDT